MEVGLQEISSEPSFRPFKRRKVYRKRTDDYNGDRAPAQNVSSPNILPSSAADASEDPMNEEEVDEESQISMAEILRLRKDAKYRKGGIEFSNSNRQLPTRPGSSQAASALVERDENAQEIQAVVNRFAPQTGQVADVNKHMMAYIDSEMAKRREGVVADMSNSELMSSKAASQARATSDAHPQRQPAALGKLHEIDLGPDATLRNIARTQAATRRLETNEPVEVEVQGKRVRLGKDGKPWRSRKRRNSEDVKRDKLVEEVLRESRLEIYDEPDADEDANEDQAADDRIAEQFRREFMDAISSRRKRTGPATQAAPVKGGKPDDRPKGPKLGGSRSARAAMREQQEKSTKKSRV
ncbi:MAG: hypothetical protein M1836_001222 [Candelina mexicana]|nr:MAG: hypothetical protein M1836_001222 [Candelina mexicana]